MTPAPKRWFRWSLRTLFVVVTLVSVPLGSLAWQAHIVRHRQQMLGQIKADGGIIFVGHVDWMHSPLVRVIRHGDYKYIISPLRSWFGDRRVSLIGFNRQLTAFDRQAVEAIPEVQIHAIP
jgi:hypothetical protein